MRELEGSRGADPQVFDGLDDGIDFIRREIAASASSAFMLADTARVGWVGLGLMLLRMF